MLNTYRQPTCDAPLPDHMEALDPRAEIYSDACRRLWAAVMGEAWRQAFFPNALETPGHVASARRWFGGRDFHIICGLLDVDPDDVMAAFHRAVQHGATRQPKRAEP